VFSKLIVTGSQTFCLSSLSSPSVGNGQGHSTWHICTGVTVVCAV
jgi:hypothetical protein